MIAQIKNGFIITVYDMTVITSIPAYRIYKEMTVFLYPDHLSSYLFKKEIIFTKRLTLRSDLLFFKL